MRVILLLALLHSDKVLSTPSIDSELQENAVKHYLAVDDFARDLFGCPQQKKQAEFDVSECRPVLASVDYVKFEKARKTAKTLFKFND